MVKWKTELPDSPGVYWVKVGTRKKIVEVVASHHVSGLAVKMEGWAMIALPLFIVDAWAGPIAEPKEAK